MPAFGKWVRAPGSGDRGTGEALTGAAAAPAASPPPCPRSPGGCGARGRLRAPDRAATAAAAAAWMRSGAARGALGAGWAAARATTGTGMGTGMATRGLARPRRGDHAPFRLAGAPGSVCFSCEGGGLRRAARPGRSQSRAPEWVGGRRVREAGRPKPGTRSVQLPGALRGAPRVSGHRRARRPLVPIPLPRRCRLGPARCRPSGAAPDSPMLAPRVVPKLGSPGTGLGVSQDPPTGAPESSAPLLSKLEEKFGLAESPIALQLCAHSETLLLPKCWGERCGFPGTLPAAWGGPIDRPGHCAQC